VSNWPTWYGSWLEALKAVLALLLPTQGRWADKYTAERQYVLTLSSEFRQAFY